MAEPDWWDTIGGLRPGCGQHLPTVMNAAQRPGWGAAA